MNNGRYNYIFGSNKVENAVGKTSNGHTPEVFVNFLVDERVSFKPI